MGPISTARARIRIPPWTCRAQAGMSLMPGRPTAHHHLDPTPLDIYTTKETNVSSPVNQGYWPGFALFLVHDSFSSTWNMFV